MSGFNNNQSSQYGNFSGNDGSNSGPSMNGGSGSSAPPSSSGNNQGLPNKGALANMTERERQALISVRDKVTTMRRIGAVGGAAVTYALLRRRKPTPGFGATIGFTILGSIAGGGLLMPAGLMWGKADMQNVEDPAHFARVLQGAADERTGRIAPGMAQDGKVNAPIQSNRTQQFGQQSGLNGSSPYPNFPPPSQSTRRTPQPSSSDNQSNQWGDDSFDESVLYGSQSQSFPSSSGQFDNANMSTSSSSNEHSQPSQSSRWAQIRGDRSAQPSSWDRLRQQNAREVYEKRNAGAGQEKEMNDRDSQYGRSNINSSTGSLADPSFGKGTSTTRAQAQREYEASFDRERRGIDG